MADAANTKRPSDASYSSIDSTADSWQSTRSSIVDGSAVIRRSSIVVTDADEDILPPASPPLPSYALPVVSAGAVLSAAEEETQFVATKPPAKFTFRTESTPIDVPIRRPTTTATTTTDRIHPQQPPPKKPTGVGPGSPDSAQVDCTRSTRLPPRYASDAGTPSFSPISAAAYVPAGSVPVSMPIGLRRALSTPVVQEPVAIVSAAATSTDAKTADDSKTAIPPTTATAAICLVGQAAGRGYWQSFGLSSTPRPLSKALAGALAGFAPPLGNNPVMAADDTDFTEAVVVSPDGKRSDVDIRPPSVEPITPTTTTTTATTTKQTVRGVRFNAATSRFAAATSTGFVVFEANSFKRLFSRTLGSNGGDLSIAELIDETNIMALVGGGPNPWRPPHTVVLWNDHLQKQIGSVAQREPILSVRISRNRLITVVERTVHVYRMRDFAHVDSVATATNPAGLIAYSEQADQAAIVAVPAAGTGSVAIVRYDADHRPAMSILKAHKSAVNCLSLSSSGRWLATASDAGTLVRLFDTKTQAQKREFRRGTLPGRICSLAFSADERWLAAASTGGTVHVFAVPDHVENTASKFAFLKSLSYIPAAAAAYFSSEWSFATFRIPDGFVSPFSCVVGFGAQAGVILAVSPTAMYRGMFNTKTKADHVLSLSMQPILAD